MKTPDVEGEVEWTVNPREFCRVPDEKLGFNTRPLDLLSCQFDGAWGEIDAGHLPAGFCERDDIRARAAADIDSAAGWVFFNEFDQFRRTDARIPGRLAEVPILKQDASEQGLHFVRFKCHRGKVTVLTLTIQMSSFTIMRLTTIPTV